jgi:hypothetical protein
VGKVRVRVSKKNKKERGKGKRFLRGSFENRHLPLPLPYPAGEILLNQLTNPKNFPFTQ